MNSNNNPDRERLDDLNIEEALGRNTPPDLTARIVQAATGAFDEALTPRHGAPSVLSRGRTAKQTRGLSRKHWKGSPFVITTLALVAVALAIFFAFKPPVELAGNRGTTAEGSNTQRAPSAVDTRSSNPAPSPNAPSANQPSGNELAPAPREPEPLPEPEPKHEPKAPEQVETPKTPDLAPIPEPKVEPKPEPGPAVEEPKPEPRPEGTEAKPEPPKAVVASMRLGAAGSKRVWSSRISDNDEWKPIQNLKDLRGVLRAPDALTVDVLDGTRLKGEGGELILANGALVRCDGVISLHVDGASVRVELIEDNVYLDNLGSEQAVRVTRGELTASVGAGAAIFEAGRGKLEITCFDGEVSAGGKTLAAKRRATLNDRGLSRELELTARDLSHPLIGGLKPRVLSAEDFDDLPAKGLIKGALAKVVEGGETVTVAQDSGLDAQVALEFDAIETLLPGQVVRVRYRQTGAEKLTVQFWNPDKKDNFGIDLPPGKPGEWLIAEIRIEKLLDRESATVAAMAGDRWQSGGVYAVGKQTKLEVDWIEFVRQPEYGR